MSTAPSAWQKNDPEHTLPSGNVAKLRPAFPVYLLLRTGQLDGELIAAYNEWTEGQVTDPAAAARLVDLIVTSMFVEPRVTTDGADGTLSIDDLDDADIDYVIQAAAGAAVDPTFRRDGDGADGGGDGEVLADAAKPAAGAAKRKSRGTGRRPAASGKAGG